MNYLRIGSINELYNYLNSPVEWNRCKEKGFEKYANFYIQLNSYLNTINVIGGGKNEEEEEEEEYEDDDDEEDNLVIIHDN